MYMRWARARRRSAPPPGAPEKRRTDEARDFIGMPAVSRLIAVRFPNLINHIIPLRSPMELSAEAAGGRRRIKRD